MFHSSLRGPCTLAGVNFALARQGPAFPALEAAGAVDLARWEEAARRLEQALPDSPHRAERIHWLTVPVALWLRRQVELAARRPLLAGLSAPQGSGKTTLCQLLVPLLETMSVRAVALSIDDFYLRREEQLALAAANPGNRYLEHRGYPGTHDLELGVRTLVSLSLHQRGEGPHELPIYDKSAHGGRGDRSSQVRRVHGPFDLVLLEGWMLGFTPTPTTDPALEVINQKLAGYDAWYRHLDVMISLRAKNPDSVLRWRAEAEARARAGGKPALTPAEVDDYTRRFLPAYETYAQTVTRGRWRPDRQLALTLDEDRIPCREDPSQP